ncbi:MAG: hypothetical protein LBM61_00340 [Prevotellaceae bacterium]|jgi:antitoxin component YwqK of YwqJK toxin-antitoxin module|nr:hypothetical protein [Prevotellaceae bacterium]
MKKLIMAICLSVLPCSALSAQIGYEEKMNQLNDQGQKEGYWVEYSGDWRFEHYYKNGVIDGISKYYTPAGKLVGIGEYDNGIETGTWYHFGDYGHLSFIQKDFSKNTYSLHHVSRLLPYKCYTITYHPNGNKKSEGILLWDESSEAELTFEYGLWKYYDEAGLLIEIREFK